MKELNDFIGAIASLAWPILAIYAFHYLRDDIRGFINRLRKGKMFGQEVELADQIADLDVTVEAAKQSIAESNSEKQNIEVLTKSEIVRPIEYNPQKAFLIISSKLEAEVNNILARTGWGDDRGPLSLSQAFSRIPKSLFANDVAVSVRQFTNIRNRIIHQYHTASDEEVLYAIEIGYKLLDILKKIEIEENRVIDLVDVYNDENCMNKIDGIKGLRIKTKHIKDGESIRILPTSKTWYEKDQIISWAWDARNMIGKAWYMNPDSNEIEVAWHSSTEFIGAPLAEIR